VEGLAETIGIDVDLLRKLIASVAAVLIVLLLRWVTLRWVKHLVEDDDGQYRARKVTAYAATLVVVITLAFVWIEGFDSLPTYLGLLSAGLAIALSDLLKNMAGWAYILVRRPFRLGDRIEIKDVRGDVIDVRLFRFSIMEVGKWVGSDQPTGRLVHVPNGWLFTDEVANYTEGFAHLWDEIPVLITFESDWERAEELILETLAERAPDVERIAGPQIRETARKYHIRVGKLTPMVYLSVRDSGVLLTARYMVGARERRHTHDKIWRGLLQAIASEPAVAVAYPTVRTYLEGPVSVSHPTSE
jgi:small-conductance mechanosensitive channel